MASTAARAGRTAPWVADPCRSPTRKTCGANPSWSERTSASANRATVRGKRRTSRTITTILHFQFHTYPLEKVVHPRRSVPRYAQQNRRSFPHQWTYHRRRSRRRFDQPPRPWSPRAPRDHRLNPKRLVDDAEPPRPGCSPGRRWHGRLHVIPWNSPRSPPASTSMPVEFERWPRARWNMVM